MKLSIEATVAGAVAMAFAVLSMAVIAQEQGERGAGGLNPGSPRADRQRRESTSRPILTKGSSDHGGKEDLGVAPRAVECAVLSIDVCSERASSRDFLLA